MTDQLYRLVDALARPTLLDENVLLAIAHVTRRYMAGGEFSLGRKLHAETGVQARRTLAGAQAQTTIQVVPIHGVLDLRPQSMGTSVIELDRELTEALQNPRVDGILLDIDSPGGSVDGIPELAAKIYGARDEKPIVALANGMMASAAYWLGSAAEEVVATSTGLVGSIGVYMVHEDWSRNLEQQGVQLTVISAGKYKTEGGPWAPLGPEAEAFFRQDVEEMYALFVKAVAAHRRDSQAAVRGGYGQGRVLRGAHAVEAKLADRIGTYDETVGRLAERVVRMGKRRPQRAEAQARRLELELAQAKVRGELG